MTDDAIRQLKDVLKQSPETYPTINKECLVALIQTYEKDIVFLQSLIADLKAESSAYDIGREDGVQWILDYLDDSKLSISCDKEDNPSQVVICGQLLANQLAKVWKERT